jgi:ABC-2 type transport system ATP-binding protein
VSLSVEKLSVVREKRRVLEEVSFSLPPGEILVVVGANGAGKTTLLEATLGFLRATGRVSWKGAPLESLADRARVFSYMPDAAEPAAEAAVSTLIAHARRLGGTSDGALEERLGLTALRSARSGELSRGEKRRLQLFCALCNSRPVIVLDEPLGTFDPLQLREVLDLLRERAKAGSSLLVSVHQMSDAEKLASRILILHSGRVLAFGTLDELRARSGAATLEAVFLALLGGANAGA